MGTSVNNVVANARDRVYSSATYAVDPQTGIGGSASPSDLGSLPALTTTTTFDADDDVTRTAAPGGLVATADCDAAGRETYASQGSAAQVYSSVTTGYDNDGNPVSTMEQDLMPTPAGTPSGTPPAYRTTYGGTYYDADGRVTATANFGTNGDLASEYASTAPTQAVTGALVSSETYGPAGFVNSSTDPAGIVTTDTTDALGRNIIVAVAKPGSSDGATQTTANTYDGMSHVTQTTVKNVVPGQANPQYQVTKDIYATTVYQVPASLTNDNLVQIQLPGYVSGSGNGTGNQQNAPFQESFTFDNLGDLTGEIDQNGIAHTIRRDAMGRETEEDVFYKVIPSNPTPSVDLTVTGRSFTYNALGQMVLASSLGAGGIDNQVKDVYNVFDQLTVQYQDHHGAVTDGSPKVQYLYNYANNASQLQTLAYPNGRELNYAYNAVGQVSALSEPQTAATTAAPILESFGYLGLGPIIQRTLGLPSSSSPNSTTTSQITGTTALDGFGRAGELDWVFSATTSGVGGTSTTSNYLDQYTYQYDADSNLTLSNNLTPGGSAFSEQYTYDSLERENGYSRGTVSGGTIASPTLSSAWQLDSQGNRYAPAPPAGSTVSPPSPYPTTTAGYNAANESSAASYDSDGTVNSLKFGTTTTSTTPSGTFSASGTESAGAKYDGWGELTQLTGANSSANIQFGYDALGRLITQGQTDFYYDGSKVVEQRDSGVVTAQYVWAPDGTLVLRDRHLAATNGGNPSTLIPNPSGTALNERIYALTDPSGSTIAITSIYGAVLERYVYDSNGQPQPLTPAWGAYATTLSSTGTDQYSSLYNWIYLYHGARWLALFTSYTTSFGYGASTTYLGGGLNEYGGGSTWVSSYDGRPVQPSLAAEISGGNAYDPTPFALQATIYGLAGTIAALRIGSYFIPGGGLVAGLTVNLLASSEERYLNNQSAGQVVGGGISDASGFTSVYGAFKNQDPFTGQALNWGTGQRWFNGIAGAVQFGGLVFSAAGSVVNSIGPGVGSALANAAQGAAQLSATFGGNIRALGSIGALGPSLVAAGTAAGAWDATAAAAGGWAGWAGGLGGLVVNMTAGFPVNPRGLPWDNPMVAVTRKTPTALVRDARDQSNLKGWRGLFLDQFASTPEAQAYFSEEELALMRDELLPDGWVIHHIQPLFRGGDNSYYNLIVVPKWWHIDNYFDLHFYPEGRNPFGRN